MLSALKVLKVNGKLGELSRPVEVSEQLKFYGKDIYRRFIETFFLEVFCGNILLCVYLS